MPALARTDPDAIILVLLETKWDNMNLLLLPDISMRRCPGLVWSPISNTAGKAVI